MECARVGPGSVATVLVLIHQLAAAGTYTHIGVRVIRQAGRKGRGRRWEVEALGKGLGQAKGMLRDTGGSDRRGCQPDMVALVRKCENCYFWWVHGV